MSSIVAVAGGSGGLGRALVDVLSKSKYKIVILSRKENPELEAEIGVRIVAADYGSVDALTALLEKHKIDTLISTAQSRTDHDLEFKLITAANQSKVTTRYIPNIWSGIDYKAKHAATFPFATLKIAIQDALKKTSLEWTALFIGLFLDYYTPGLPTHVKVLLPIAVDTLNNVAGIPGSGDVPVNLTHTSDVGKFVVALLGLEKWEQKYFLAGGVASWNEIVAIAEKVKGVKFEVSYDSVEDLANGRITELPGHRKAYAGLGGAAAEPMIKGMLAILGMWQAQGMWDFGEGTSLNDLFPEIQTLGVQEAFEKSFLTE